MTETKKTRLYDPVPIFFALPDEQQLFLKRLCQFGGACTSSDAIQALGYKDTKCREALSSLVRKDQLAQQRHDFIWRAEAIYYPCLRLGRLLGCRRSPSKDPEALVLRTYRFSIALQQINTAESEKITFEESCSDLKKEIGDRPMCWFAGQEKASP